MQTDNATKQPTDPMTRIVTISCDSSDVSRSILEELYDSLDDEDVRLCVKTSLPNYTRKWWEDLCFEVGFRKHRQYFDASPYGCLDDEYSMLKTGDVNIVIHLDKIPPHILSLHPIEALKTNRRLHMDMSRESGKRSDAHNMRYYKASRLVSDGDRVLDVACGMGYGSDMISNHSDYLGIDGDADAIMYAGNMYAGSGKRFMRGHLPDCLCDQDDESFDFIVSFETLEHLHNPQDFLRECYRLLSPNGRIMLSVPNDWSGPDGVDPNPHHLHVYTWHKIMSEVEQAGFTLCDVISQTVSHHKSHTDPDYLQKGLQRGVWVSSRYDWTSHKHGRGVFPPSEWCIILAHK